MKSISFSETMPKELFPPSWLSDYERNTEAIWHQLVKLNSTMFILEKILAFRFDLFGSASNHFWNLIKDAQFEYSIMTIWRLIDDGNSSGLSLNQFKNGVVKNLQTVGYRDKLKSLLKRVNYEGTTKDMRAKITEIRHNYIAHFHLDKNIKPRDADLKARALYFSELQEFRNRLNAIFQILCFGHGRGLLPIEYYPMVEWPKDLDKRPDIEQLLDDIARKSAVLNMAEEQPDYWNVYRGKLSEAEMTVINQYRIKFGLPSA